MIDLENLPLPTPTGPPTGSVVTRKYTEGVMNMTNEDLRYLNDRNKALEERITTLEQRIAAIEQRIAALKQQSGLMSPSIWRRAFTVLGLWVLAYVVIGVVIGAVMGVAVILLQGLGG